MVGLRAISLASAALPGRKNIGLFSQEFPRSEQALVAMAAVVDSANGANASIYVVDPGGLTTGRAAGAMQAENSRNLAAPARNRFRRRIAAYRRFSSASKSRLTPAGLPMPDYTQFGSDV